ncbi:MAG TPA: aminotransferase class V-fold PLP-dependent enzyme, partial [Chlamydiales bacterium]|nr:aminotransferase class V-fold PLP-dependent enzyme [Chlamydiales bacterium]
MTTCTSIREEFPILKKMVNGFPLIYLDSAATTHKPKRVIDAISEFYSEDYATVHRAIYELSIAATEKYDAARKKASRFLNASTEDEIIFTRGTTDSINFVAKSFAKRFLKAGDEIILTELEHHSNLVPWQMVAEEYGLKLHFIPINDQGEIILSEYERLLSKKTKIVSVAHVFNTA